MVQKTDIAWCPGCGNFPIRDVLEKAFQELPIPMKNIVLTSGIGRLPRCPSIWR
jgi:2-oxoglutarate ferredoxin oxidoreductase subunit beta